VSTWILVWFIVAVISTSLVLLCLAGLVRQVILLGRTARQIQDEVQPLMSEVSREGQRASGRASSLQVPGRTHRS
jgi:hypothetical protein